MTLLNAVYSSENLQFSLFTIYRNDFHSLNDEFRRNFMTVYEYFVTFVVLPVITLKITKFSFSLSALVLFTLDETVIQKSKIGKYWFIGALFSSVLNYRFAAVFSLFNLVRLKTHETYLISFGTQILQWFSRLDIIGSFVRPSVRSKSNQNIVVMKRNVCD